MATSGLEYTCETHFLWHTCFTRCKACMSIHFRAINPKIWWIIDIGFSHTLDELNPTKEQEKCLDVDAQATNILLGVKMFSMHGSNFKFYMKDPALLMEVITLRRW